MVVDAAAHAAQLAGTTATPFAAAAVLIVWIALRKTKPKDRVEIINALAKLFRRGPR